MLSNVGSTDSLHDVMNQVPEPIDLRRKECEKDHGPPHPPCSPNFTFGSHVFFVEGCCPHKIFNCLVAFLSSQVEVSGIKVRLAKYAVKAEVFVDGISCTVKARIYSYNGKYAVDTQRRAGDSFIFQSTRGLLMDFVKAQCGVTISGHDDAMSQLPVELPEATACEVAVCPAAPQLRPLSAPFSCKEMEEFVLPECAVCPAAPQLRPLSDPLFFEDMEEFVLPDCVRSWMSPIPSMTTTTPMSFDYLGDLGVPNVMDTGLEDPAVLQDRTSDQSPSKTLSHLGAIGTTNSSEMIFTLEGLSDTSSNVDADDFSLKELFDCDVYDEYDSLESPADVSMLGACAQSKVIWDQRESLEFSAPHDASAFQFGSPILMTLLRASSSCSTREPTPSPKGVFGKREMPSAVHKRTASQIC